ncbi:MAG: hypothetical protein Fur002_03280 [Anaerolineales bacterium]
MGFANELARRHFERGEKIKRERRVKKRGALLLLLWLTACNLQTTPPAPTAAPSATFTPAPTQISPSATPAILTLRVKAEKANCRYGPSSAYAFINELTQGQAARAVGKNADGSWLYVRDSGNPGGFCWMSAQTLEAQDGIEALAIIPPPPVSVSKISIRTEPERLNLRCDQFPQTIFFEAQATTNGPAIVTWRLETSAGYVSAEHEMIFETAGTQPLNGYYVIPAGGEYRLTIHALAPNDLSATLNFPASCTP